MAHSTTSGREDRKWFSRSELIQRAGIGAEHTAMVAHICSHGIISARRRAGGRYQYDTTSVRQLRLVRKLYQYSFVLDEIAAIFTAFSDSDAFQRLERWVGKVPPNQLYGFLGRSPRAIIARPS